MNPDGYAANTYENANGVNLNRDFPDVVFRKSSTLGLAGTEQVSAGAEGGCCGALGMRGHPMRFRAPSEAQAGAHAAAHAPAPAQPETAAVMKLFMSRQFTAAANMHEVRGCSRVPAPLGSINTLAFPKLVPMPAMPQPVLQGDFVVNYPFDGTASGLFDYNATPDDATFRFLARVYASRNPRVRAVLCP